MGPGTKTLSKPAQGVRVGECLTLAERSAQMRHSRKSGRGRNEGEGKEMLKERRQEKRGRGKEWEMRKGRRGRRGKRRI